MAALGSNPCYIPLRQGIEHWSMGEIQEASTGLTLLYGSLAGDYGAEYKSAETTYLILPDEGMDAITFMVRERAIDDEPVAQPVSEKSSPGDLGEAPF